MAQSAASSNTAVIPFIDAYIGGKNVSASTFGIRIPKSNATTTGMAIETILIHNLNFFSVGFSVLLIFK